LQRGGAVFLKNRPAFKNTALTIISVVAGAIFLFPLIWMVHASLLPDALVIREINTLKQLFPLSLSFQNYADVFRRVSFLKTLAVSFGFVLVIITVGLFFNAACAFALARIRFRGSGLILTAVTALIIIPFEALAIPLFLMVGVKWQLMNTLPGLFLPFLVKAFNIFFLRQYFLSLPTSLEEAARVEGASWFRIFLSIGLPLARPALVTCVLLDFVTHWSEYLWPLLMTNIPSFETVQIGLGHFYTLPPIQWGDIMAYSVMATIPVAIVFLFFQRQITQSFLQSGLKM